MILLKCLLSFVLIVPVTNTQHSDCLNFACQVSKEQIDHFLKSTMTYLVTKGLVTGQQMLIPKRLPSADQLLDLAMEIVYS